LARNLDLARETAAIERSERTLDALGFTGSLARIQNPKLGQAMSLSDE